MRSRSRIVVPSYEGEACIVSVVVGGGGGALVSLQIHDWSLPSKEISCIRCTRRCRSHYVANCLTAAGLHIVDRMEVMFQGQPRPWRN